MDRPTALKLSEKMKIHFTQIVREEWELFILRRLMESGLGDSLVFKGGTALRLAYGSPRFSEDLDFSLLKDITSKEFKKQMQVIKAGLGQVEITDLIAKYYTYLAEVKIKEVWQDIAFRIKIEISKRKFVEEDRDYEVVLLNSPVTNIQVLSKVMTLEGILKEKYEAVRTRAKPRDIFDIWYIAQRLKVKIKLKRVRIPKKELRQVMRKYLPQDYWQVIDNLTEYAI